MKKIFGNWDGTLQIYKGYPRVERVGNYKYRITYRYWGKQETALSEIPAYAADCPISGLSSHKLLDAEIAPNDTPGLVDVTLVYRLPGSSGHPTTHENNETQKSSITSWIEIAIDDPRLISGGYLTSDQVAKAKARGKVTFGMGSVEYTYTEWTDDPTWSESELTSGVGDTSAPDGLSGATASKWMKIGISMRSDGDLTEKATTWKYHALGWDED